MRRVAAAALVLEAERLVEADGPRVVREHFELDAGEALLPRGGEHGAHQAPADTLPAVAVDDEDAEPARVGQAHAGVGDDVAPADHTVAVECDEVRVPGFGHRVQVRDDRLDRRPLDEQEVPALAGDGVERDAHRFRLVHPNRGDLDRHARASAREDGIVVTAPPAHDGRPELHAAVTSSVRDQSNAHTRSAIFHSPSRRSSRSQ